MSTLDDVTPAYVAEMAAVCATDSILDDVFPFPDGHGDELVSFTGAVDAVALGLPSGDSAFNITLTDYASGETRTFRVNITATEVRNVGS